MTLKTNENGLTPELNDFINDDPRMKAVWDYYAVNNQLAPLNAHEIRYFWQQMDKFNGVNKSIIVPTDQEIQNIKKNKI
jgi:hypothetical protein